MCTVSMVGDFYRDTLPGKYPYIMPHVFPDTNPTLPGFGQFFNAPPAITRAEFDALKAEVAQMKELLKRAKEYDERNHEPDCEVEEKMDLLRKVAKLVGVNLDDVIGKGK